jgi:hypothetical protein
LGGEGDELMRSGDDAHDGGRGADQPDLPSGQRENLARRADFHTALAHALHRHQRDMDAAVENDMFPDFVAERDRVISDAEPRQQRQRLTVIDDAGRIERIVEEDHARS